MKPKLIIAIVAIIGFTSLLMYNFGESISTYTDFESARTMNNAHVAGVLDDTQDYGFSMETKQFSFYMKDESGAVHRVIYPKPKPNNFEEADRIVVIGEMRGETFYAKDMLMKCPSKYNNADPSEFTSVENS